MATIEDQPERTLESRLRFSREMMAGPIYRKYEKAMRKFWDPGEFDYEADARDFQALTPEQQRGIVMITVRFLGGEQEVTDETLPMIYASHALGKFDWTMFLSSFMMEEARHSQFFAMWHDKVVGIVDPDELREYWIDREKTVDPTGRYATGEPVYEGLPFFGHQLIDACHAGDLAAVEEGFVRYSTLYNIWVEGVLTMPSYEIVIDTCDIWGKLGTLRHGFKQIVADEGRHITFGTAACRELIEKRPELEQVVHDAINLYRGNAVGMLEYQRFVPELDLQKYQLQKVRHYKNRCRELNITPDQTLIDDILDPNLDFVIGVEAG